MSEANKRVVRRLIEELWNQGNPAVAEELFTPNYNHHDASTPDFGRGPESEVKRMNLYRGAFPDLRITIENIISESDTVMARWSCHGTHKGELSGIPPTARSAEEPDTRPERLMQGPTAPAIEPHPTALQARAENERIIRREQQNYWTTSERATMETLPMIDTPLVTSFLRKRARARLRSYCR